MTDSLKNMIKSVDWKKLLSNGDAKNALVGSALGGLMLGGASLAGDRDPEESKMAPVGDALMGALLGGVAGYGIPKGLSLFRDAGSLAPAGDQISGMSPAWSIGGALAGGGLVGGSLFKTFKDTVRGLEREARDRNPGAVAAARTHLRDIQDRIVQERGKKSPSPSVLASLARDAAKAQMELNAVDLKNVNDFGRDTDRLRRLIAAAKKSKDAKAVGELRTQLKELLAQNRFQTRGFDSLSQLISKVPLHSSTPGGRNVSGWFHALTSWKEHPKFFSDGSHYKHGPVNIPGLRHITSNFRPHNQVLTKMLGRGAKYGVLGAGVGTGIGYLLNRLFKN